MKENKDAEVKKLMSLVEIAIAQSKHSDPDLSAYLSREILQIKCAGRQLVSGEFLPVRNRATA